VFGMIPPPASDKDDEKSKQRYDVIAAGRAKGIDGDEYYGYRSNLLDEVRAAFARHGVAVDERSVILHPGLFENTWSHYNGDSIAFAHIDCDWYEPVKFSLERVGARIPPGGVIVLDDYHDYGGCRAATDEFLVKHGEFALEDGANAIIRRS